METVVVGLEMFHVEPLRWAADYCRVMGGELFAVVAYRPSQAEVPPDWFDEQITAIRKKGEAVVGNVAEGIPHRFEVRDGDPRSVIEEVAAEAGASLVVVGRHGSGGFQGRGLGTVAHHLAHHLATPLAVVPNAGDRMPPGRSVLVALDGSASDESTLEWGMQLAMVESLPMTAVYASDRRAASQLEEVVRDEVDQAAADGVDICLTVDVDHPASAIQRAAARENARVVVVGRAGTGGVLLGHVVSTLPFHADRPVVIVPRHAAA
jgi:nucleotide-binding universal stress UspA family protein